MPMLMVAYSMQVSLPGGAIDRMSLLNLATFIVGAEVLMLARVAYGVDRVHNRLPHWLRLGAKRAQCIVQCAACDLDPGGFVDASSRRRLDLPDTNGAKGDSKACPIKLSILGLEHALICLNTPSTGFLSVVPGGYGTG